MVYTPTFFYTFVLSRVYIAAASADRLADGQLEIKDFSVCVCVLIFNEKKKKQHSELFI